MTIQVLFLTPLWFNVLYFSLIHQPSFNVWLFLEWYRNQFIILIVLFLFSWQFLVITSVFIPKLFLLVLPSTDIHRLISGIPSHEHLITQMLPQARQILEQAPSSLLEDIQVIENARATHINTHLQIFALFAAILSVVASVGVINIERIRAIINGVNTTVAQMVNDTPSLLSAGDVQTLVGIIVAISTVASYFYVQSAFKTSRMLDIIDVTCTILLREREHDRKSATPLHSTTPALQPPHQLSGRPLQNLSFYTIVVVILIFLDRLIGTRPKH